MTRVGKWSRVSRETRLKIGLAISRDLKCETCKTQKLAKIMHFGSFWEGNINFSVNSAKECYARHRITWKNLNIPQKNINFSHFFKFLMRKWHILLNIHGLASLASLARHYNLVSQSRETWKMRDFANPTYDWSVDPFMPYISNFFSYNLHVKLVGRKCNVIPQINSQFDMREVLVWCHFFTICHRKKMAINYVKARKK